MSKDVKKLDDFEVENVSGGMSHVAPPNSEGNNHVNIKISGVNDRSGEIDKNRIETTKSIVRK